MSDEHALPKKRKTKNEFFIVEGDARGRRHHRHVTPSPGRQSNFNVSGDVTKIEVVLEEASDETILTVSVPSESNATIEFNTTYPDGIPGTSAVVVRAEEALIVVLVLVLWVAAIALFFNRWGKIRMLEPYQPKFQQQHRQSCTMVDANMLTDHPGGQIGQSSCVGGGVLPRPRQNSVFVGSSTSLLLTEEETPRRAKSAFDIQSIVLAECTVQIPQEDGLRERDKTKREFKTPSPDGGAPRVNQRRRSICRFDDLDKPLQQRERGMSVSQIDRGESQLLPTVRTSLRDRGMSICYFDRTDVLARPLQRDRGSSICHFDRMDVLARPTLRDHGSSVCQFDRMDVLARPSTSYLAKSLFLRERERRLSVCNFIEKNQEEAREHRAPTSSHVFQKYDRPSSVNNVEKIETVVRSTCSSSQPVSKENTHDSSDFSCFILEQRDDVEQNNDKKENSTAYYFDRPSCSKAPDVVLGYKATRV
ncbi:hypothetical protein KPH14_011387 [Odynerus spinipes]|uniref:Fibronectin type III domain-containing protein n=1 Tax=Odynerus spinipes TaxID=1348599 RepID=A0AAD9VTI7_9HYME|nr:hypothetical protein KPH14_011387 [Odynerus spinipes]